MTAGTRFRMASASDISTRISELRRRLNDASHRYHVLDDPAIPDAEYDAMLRELGVLHETYGRAASTRREGRALLRKLWTAAVANGVEPRTLADLLQAEPTLTGLERLSRNKAARLLQDLHGTENNRITKNNACAP